MAVHDHPHRHPGFRFPSPQLMWIAEWPPAKHLSDGSLSMSTNPFADYHLVYAVAARGLGEEWARLPFVSRNRWLLRTHRPRSFVLLCRSPS